MSLTKLQTAAICFSLAALPLGYQWHALSSARSAGAQLNSDLQKLRTGAFASEKDQAQAERRVANIQNELAQPLPAASAEAPKRRAEVFNWDENSAYVRVPKNVVTKIRFAPFATRVARDGKTEQFQLPSLTADGSPQPALEAALGLSNDEAARLRTLCQQAFASFSAIAASHSQLTESTFANSQIPTVKLDTAAFADEGARFRDQFQAQLVSLLGQERADTFWQQATPMFTELFNDFGARPRTLQLINNPAGLELLNQYANSSSIGQLAQRNGMPLPQQLQAYAQLWSQPPAQNGTQPAQPR